MHCLQPQFWRTRSSAECSRKKPAPQQKAEQTDERHQGVVERGSHFTDIAKMITAGDFSAPMLIHTQNRPGTAEMERLRDAIQYKLENTEQGARIRISSKNLDAIQVVHVSLRFQTADHQTGDSTEVSK